MYIKLNLNYYIAPLIRGNLNSELPRSLPERHLRFYQINRICFGLAVFRWFLHFVHVGLLAQHQQLQLEKEYRARSKFIWCSVDCA